MSMRTRILLAIVVAATVPLIVFAVGARNEVATRLGAQYEARVSNAVTVIRDDLARTAADIDNRLAALAASIGDDAATRAALMQQDGGRALHDYASRVMPSAGMDYLLLADAEGTVLSSGHFRSDYGRSAAGIVTAAGWPGPLIISAHRPAGAFLSLGRVRPFTIAGRTFLLAGGLEVDSSFVRRLARDDTGTLVVALAYPGGDLASSSTAPDEDAYVERLSTPFVDDATAPSLRGAPDTEQPVATWAIHHSAAPLAAIRRGTDAWLLAAIAAAVVLAAIIARLLAARVNRPLEELAARARRVDLDRLDTSFATRRYDEIGSLARVLDAMVQRLRTSAAELRSAERRATVGDIARQVNHDIRNGLLPIRHVIRHLDEVAHASPADLPQVFAERAPTLHSGVGYLENLASSYARLTPAADRAHVDVNAVIRAAVDAAPGVTLRLDPGSPVVAGDAVSLRRVVENLVVNALDSLRDGDGGVTVATARENSSDRMVVITVADTGSGIAASELDRIFDDFHTTKPHGTGLGLSIVRRLVNDMGGRIRVTSEPGRGTTFRIDLPEAG